MAQRLGLSARQNEKRLSAIPLDDVYVYFAPIYPTVSECRGILWIVLGSILHYIGRTWVHGLQVPIWNYWSPSLMFMLSN